MAPGSQREVFDAFLAWMRATGFTWRDEEIEFRLEGGTLAVLSRTSLGDDYAVCSMPKAGMLTIRTTGCADLLEQHGVRDCRAHTSANAQL